MQRKIIETEDGSSSLYIPELDEHYHSVHGAVQESMHVFIEAGLKHLSKKSIKIFEMGYGTGLNYLLTYLNAGDKTIEYYGIEAFPLEEQLVEQLNFTRQLNLDDDQERAFRSIHNSENAVCVSESFLLYKEKCKLSEFKTEALFDLIYFDAFAPDVQPDLWTEPIFQKMFDLLNTKGVLTTYCAKGVVRRTMQVVGFSVERIPGPPGKREMLRATKL